MKAMLAEAVAALAALSEGRAGDAKATAQLAIATAMAVVIDAAGAFEEEDETLAEFVAELEADDIKNIAAAARPWAAAVYADMVPEGAKTGHSQSGPR
jgi:hypothetical protein